MELSDLSDDGKDNHELYIVKLEHELDRARLSFQINESIWNEKEGSLNSIISEQKQVISLLESLLKSNQQFYDQLQESVTQKDVTLQAVNVDIENTLAQTKKQIDILTRAIEKTETLLSQKEAELQRQNAQIAEQQKHILALEKTIQNAEQKSAEVNQQSEQYRKQLDEITHRLQESHRQRDGFKRARDHLQQQYDELTTSFDNSRNELLQLLRDQAEKLENVDLDLFQKVQQLEQYRDVNEKAEHQNKELSGKLSEAIELYETANQAAREVLKQKLAGHVQELEQYRDLNQKAERQNKELNRKLSEAIGLYETGRQARDDQQRKLELQVLELDNAKFALNEKANLAETALSELHHEQRRYADLETQFSQIKEEQRFKCSEYERQLTVERINRTEIELKRKELNEKNERASINLTGLFAREQRYKQNIVELEQRLISEKEKAYQTISYQVGHAFVQASKSFRGFCRLPSQLLTIRKEARLRKTRSVDKKKLNRIPNTTNRVERPEFAVAPSVGLVSNEVDATYSRKLRIAAIMDEFTFHSYKPEAELLQLHPDSWKTQLNEFKPDLLFIESAWHGLDSLWKAKISNADAAIIGIIEWCQENKVPSLFWNKEDPVHFSTFLPVASRVDVVFTTDIDCLPKYKQAVGHSRVFLLPFAAQPLTHNPIEKYDRKDAFNFAGSYYLRYPERQRDFASLIETVKKLRPLEIYDRNFENPHPHYQFPEKYHQYILGSLPFDQIDKAYKGYRYGINMNTIKQSQTMFARRVFELLASNTVVVSNFSRGVRMMFGDLVVSSDNAEEINRRLQRVCNDEVVYRKFRLLGLRKVMAEHTYAARLQYISETLLGHRAIELFPKIIVVARVSSQAELSLLLANIKRQSYKNIEILVIGSDNIKSSDMGISVLSDEPKLLGEFETLRNDCYIAYFSNRDYYGENYLLDLVVAHRYSDATAFGKVSYYLESEGVAVLVQEGKQYTTVSELDARSSIIRRAALSSELFLQAASSIDSYVFNTGDLLSLDEFNYCRNGTPEGSEVISGIVDDLVLANQGLSFERDIFHIASEMTSSSQVESATTLPQISAAELSQRIPKSLDPQIQWGMKRGAFHINSKLTADKFVYIYSRRIYTRAEMNMVLNSQFKLDCDTTCQLKTVFEFQDAGGQKIAHSMNNAGDFNSLAIPEHCVKIRFGLRVQGPGEAAVRKLILGNYGQKPSAIVGTSPHLVLTKQYPDYDDLYKYGFLHTRLRAYKERGLYVDVYRMTNEDGNTYREFEDVDVVSGDATLLDATLSTGQYRNVLVHLLDERMWAVLSKYLDKVHVTVWVHGAEIQVWQRRQFEFERFGSEEIKRQKRLSERRLKFWQSILKDPHPNLELVFVSQYFANEVAEDFSIDLSKINYDIVHNFIDSDIFPYIEKSDDHRRRLLSIRPYASRKYANDLTVKAILELSTRDFFNDLQIALYGDGELFDEITSPLKGFANVQLHRRFLSHREIAMLHKDYGIFLTPTRMDSQGVSRDEAMSSGLVPITTSVTAIPEFVDDNCGMLVDADDYVAMADAVELLYRKPELFRTLSINASERVRRQSGLANTILKEIRIIERGAGN